MIEVREWPTNEPPAYVTTAKTDISAATIRTAATISATTTKTDTSTATARTAIDLLFSSVR